MLQNEFEVRTVHTTAVAVTSKGHKLPPDLGGYEEFKVADYHCPESWSKDAIFLSVKEGEKLWFDLRANWDCACIPAMQKVNPVLNKPADLKEGLKKDPEQNYLRLPEQKWIDGYNNAGIAYQFTITKQGLSLSVAENILPVEMQDSQSIGFAFFPAKKPKEKPKPKSADKHITIMGLSQVFSQPYPAVLYNSPPPEPTQWKGIGSQPIGSYPVWCDVEPNPPTAVLHKGATSSSSAMRSKKSAAQASGLRGINMAMAPVMSDTVSYDSSNQLEQYGNDVSYNESVVMSAEMPIAASAEMPITADVEMLDVDDPTLEKAGMGAGGRIIQEIYQDHNTVDYYVDKPVAVLTIYFALPDQFERIMKKGKRQDPEKKDKYVHSGNIGGKQIPLIK